VDTGTEMSAVGPVQPPVDLLAGAEGVAFLPDGHLAVGRGGDPSDYDTVARILEPSTGREILALRLSVARPHDIDVNRAGTLLGARTDGGLLLVWRLPDGEMLATPTTAEAEVMDVEFSFDGRFMASANANGTATLWEVTDNGLIEVLAIGHKGPVEGVAMSHDNTRLATSASGVARVWDISPVLRGEVLTLPGTESFHADVLFTPDGKWIVGTSGPEGVVRVFDAESGEIRHVLDPGDSEGTQHWGNMGIDISPDGTRIATSSLDGTVRIYDVQTGAERVTFRQHGCAPDGTCGVSGVAFSPDGLSVASNGYDATVRIFDSETGRQLHVINHNSDPQFPSAHPVAWSPDGERLLAMTFSATHVWQASSREYLFSIPPSGGPMQTAGWTPDGSRAVVEGGAGPTLWDAQTGAPVGALTTGQGNLGLAFTHDGAFAAVGGLDKVLWIWDLELAAVVLRLPVPGPGRVAFSPDGQSVAHTSWDGASTAATIRVFALDDERLLQIARERVTRSLTDDECREYLQAPCADG
jgi:WD40 repeat protein